MAQHYGHIKEKKSTPHEWLGFGKSLGELANEWSGRNDLVALVGPEAAKESGAPAAFDPMSAEVMVNTDIAFGKIKPSKIGDFKERSTQFEYAKATGAIWHESMHAKFTLWDLLAASKELTPNENQALHILEESRMEGMGIRHQPNMKNFIRACALEIVIGDVKETASKLSDTRAAAHLSALTLARVDAGTLDEDDILAIHSSISDVLGEELEGKLRKLWREFQSIHRVTEPGDVKELYRIAREWNRIVQDAAEEKGEGAERKNGNGHEGDGQDGMPGGAGMGGILKEIMEALGEDAEATAVGVLGDLADQEATEEYAAAAAAQNREHDEKKQNQRTFQEIIKRADEGKSASRSRIVSKRPPSGDEHRAAVTLAKELDKAKYQDRVRIDGRSIMPPGRLHTRALVQNNALKAQGVMQRVEPWRRVMRKHVDDPNLTIGVMVDISGSMSAAMEPMASAAWILSEAGKRVEAKSAMVYYGSDVFPTLRPGQTLKDVNVYNAPDGTESPGKAFEALDGALDLLQGTGARMVVLVSDGQYTAREQDNVRAWLKKFERAGVGVLWLGYGWADNAEMFCGERRNAECVRIGDRDSTTKAAMAIGRAAVKAVNAASETRR